jgi:hypothetical protein
MSSKPENKAIVPPRPDRCERCRHWFTSVAVLPDGWNECHADAPRLGEGGRAKWPHTQAGEGCGRFAAHTAAAYVEVK